MLKKISFKDQVYEYLKKAIVKGDLTPGEIYSEQMFADKLSVSRTPVREAVQQLKNEDLVEIFNNRGFGIKQIVYEDIKQIIQARIAIEGYSVRYLTEHIQSSEGQQALCKLIECMEREITFSSSEQGNYEFMEADIEFHRHIVKFANNIYFIKTFDMMQNRIEQVIVNSLSGSQRSLSALKEHEEILKYIQSGDVSNAVKAFETHMQITEQILKKYSLG